MNQQKNPFYSEKVMEHFSNPRNVGEIENADGIGTVGNPTCLKAGSLVLTNPGATAIEELAVGKKVLGHDGQYHKITKVFSRDFDGDIYKLRVHNLGQIELTEEHLIYAKKLSGFRYKSKASDKIPADWFSPKELESGDCILFPIAKKSSTKEYIELNQAKPKYDFKSGEIPEKFEINAAFLKIIGFYLAEGYVRTDASKGTVGFAFGGHEEQLVSTLTDMFYEVFGLKPGTINRKNNAIRIPFYSARLARFFSENFGKGALEKRLPFWALELPPELQKNIIYGLWLGDGYLNNQKSVAKFVTISKTLAFQTRQLLFRQKIDCSFLTSQAYDIHKKHYSVYVKKQQALKKLAQIIELPFTYKLLKKNPSKNWFDEEYYYSPIWEISKNKYKGKVFNLEVEKSHSYVTEAAAVHNCGDVMQLSLKIKDGVIEDIKFKTFGCGAAIATSSMTTELVKGKTIEEAVKISNRTVAEALDGLPPVKMHCSVLAEEALQAALEDYFTKNPGERIPLPRLKKHKEPHDHEH